MTAPATVSFDLGGYDMLAASKAITRARLTFWVRQFTLIFLIYSLSGIALLAVLPWGSLAPSLAVSGVWGAGFVPLMIAGRRAQAMIRAGRAHRSLRQGRTSVEITEAGLKISTLQSEQLFYWSGLHDIVSLDDGLAICTTPLMFFPVPGSAFASPAAQTDFIDALRARIAAAQGATS